MRITDPAGHHVGEWHHDAATHLTATDIAVTAQATTVADETLAGGARINGRVRSRATTLPLPGATVALYRASGGLVALATTGPSGWYDFAGVPPDTYLIKATHPDHFTEWYQDQLLAATASPLTVGVGQTLTLDGYPAVTYLTPLATPELAGTVTAEGTGTPVPGAVVRLYTPSGQLGATVTAGDGTWRIGGLAKHTDYLLRIEATGYRTEWWDDAPTSAAARTYAYNGTNPIADIDVVLTPAP